MNARLSAAIDALRKRVGHNVLWLLLVAALAAALVVPLYLFDEPGAVLVRQPVYRGELRPAPAAPVPPPPAPPAPREARKPDSAPAKSAPAKLAPPPPPKPLVLSDARTPKPAPPPAKTPPSANSAPLYQVQLGAFAVESRAHRLAQDAASEGFPAVVMQVTVASGQVLHRVRLRDALPKAQAEALQANLKQKIPSLDPILVVGER